MTGDLFMRLPSFVITTIFLASATFVSASFNDYRDRDATRFTPKEPKPFRQDKDVASIVMREGIPRGGGYTYQYPRENP